MLILLEHSLIDCSLPDFEVVTITVLSFRLRNLSLSAFLDLSLLYHSTYSCQYKTHLSCPSWFTNDDNNDGDDDGIDDGDRNDVISYAFSHTQPLKLFYRTP